MNFLTIESIWKSCSHIDNKQCHIPLLNKKIKRTRFFIARQNNGYWTMEHLSWVSTFHFVLNSCLTLVKNDSKLATAKISNTQNFNNKNLRILNCHLVQNYLSQDFSKTEKRMLFKDSNYRFQSINLIRVII